MDLPTGWGNYKDSGSGNQTINTTAAKIQIDGAGSTSSSLYLPREIRGSAELWDTTNDKITPIRAGDAYDMRLDLPITAKSGSPNKMTITLDIGGAAGITVPIVAQDFVVTGTAPYVLSVTFPVFALATFVTNGGQLFAEVDTGTLTCALPGIFITKTSDGDL